MKKLIIILLAVVIFTLGAIVSYAQEKNSYEDFKEVEFFSSVVVHIKGDSC